MQIAAGFRLQQTSFSEARVAFVFSDDDMVVKRDPENLAGFDKLPGYSEILARRLHVTGGVIVRNDDRSRAHHVRASLCRQALQKLLSAFS